MTTPTNTPEVSSTSDEDVDLFCGRDPFIPRDAFLSNKGCPRFTGIPELPVPCSNCPGTRCWFQESVALRKAGLPAMTPREWRILVKATTPEDFGDDEDGDLGDFELEG